MAFIVSTAEDSEFFRDLTTTEMPDRIVAILSGVILDERLVDAIQAHCLDMDFKGTTIFKELFRDGAPVGSFKTRINLGFALGLYGEEVYADLVIINKIRNEFAHKLQAKDFNSQQITALINNLKVPEIYQASEDGTETVNKGDPDGFIKSIIAIASIAAHMTGARKRYVRAVEIISSVLLNCEVHAKRPVSPRL